MFEIYYGTKTRALGKIYLEILLFFTPWIPGLGWFIFFANQFASFVFGFGIQDLGAWADEEQGKGPGDNVNAEDAEDLGYRMNQKLQTKAASSEDEFKKVAVFGGLIKLVGGIKRFTGFLIKIIKYLLLLAGFKEISNLYKGSVVESIVEPMLPKNKDKEKQEQLQTKKKEEGPGAMEEAVMMQKFLQDPSRLITKLF